MSSELQEIIHKLSYDELKALEKDLSMGVPFARSLAKERIQRLESAGKSCAVCGSSINERDNIFTLVFGMAGFKKKATFCAIDCLGYFIEKLKEIKQKNKGGLKSTIKNS